MLPSEAARFGLSEEYWERLSEKDREMYRLFRPLRRAAYSVQHRILDIETTLGWLDEQAQNNGGQLELMPDFQRGHVWDRPRQVAFMQAAIRGTAPLEIRFNCPSWGGDVEETVVQGLNASGIQCIDGLQRLTALRDFVAGRFKVFNGYSLQDLEGTPFSFRRTGMAWTLEMFTIATRADLLQFYLDLNTGGVVHAPEEICRVTGLLDNAKEKPGRFRPRGAERVASWSPVQ